MLDMFKGVVNSPQTTTTNDINNTDTLIYVLDETRIPSDLPNLMTLGTGTNAETIKVLNIDGNAITVERGFQGVAKSWNQGTIIARNFTEYDYNALKENIEGLRTDADVNISDITDLMGYVGNLANLDTTEKSNIVLALNEIYQDLLAHKADYAKDATIFNMTLNSGFKAITPCTYQKKNGFVFIRGEFAKSDDTEFAINVPIYPLNSLPIGFRPNERITLNSSGNQGANLTPLEPYGSALGSSGGFFFQSKAQVSKVIGFAVTYYVGGGTV